MIRLAECRPLKSEGYLVTSFATLDSTELLEAFRTFIHRVRDYQLRFLQKRYGYAYDGFSYYGQTDSSHQAEDDSSAPSSSPSSTRWTATPKSSGLPEGSWKKVVQTVRSLETDLLKPLDNPVCSTSTTTMPATWSPTTTIPATAVHRCGCRQHPAFRASRCFCSPFSLSIDEELELQVTGETGRLCGSQSTLPTRSFSIPAT